MNEVERMQALIRLALGWIDLAEENMMSTFIPNHPELDKVAKTRTGACAKQLLKVLGGREQ
jgi:hypothetical protein